MEAPSKVAPSNPAEQVPTTADSLRSYLTVLERFVYGPSQPPTQEEVVEQAWQDSAEWLDHLAQFDGKGGAP